MQRNVPDAEKAQHMVNAVGIEILSHLLEPSCPPPITILCHSLPIVGGESPVLPVLREIIRWCTRLSIQIEQMRFRPCLHAVARNADGDVTFDDYPVLPCLVPHLQQLQVKLILHIIEESHLLVILGTLSCQFIHSPLIIDAVFWPFPELSSSIQVSQV